MRITRSSSRDRRQPQVAVISGPNLASEIAECQPAATVVACSDSGRALQRALNSGTFRPLLPTPMSSAPRSWRGVQHHRACVRNGGGIGLGETPRRSSPGAPAEIRLTASCQRHVGRSGRGRDLRLPAPHRVRATDRLANACRGETLQPAGALRSCRRRRRRESVLALASSYDVEMPPPTRCIVVIYCRYEAITLLLGRRTKPG